ncbi:MAG: mechanosensitive ion channel family protein [Holosporales bacterium]|nr:mechanosensitive ion channel family protein [Holosporales bacterium]
MDRTKKSQEDETLDEGTAQVLLTTITVSESMARFLILVVGALACLSAVNISVSPIVYGLGLASVGISLGAQDTFTDVIRGILTLIEGKIAPGNCLCINGEVGYVENLTIRQIVLRHFDGSLEFFPYSKIGTIRNFSLGSHTMECNFSLATDADIKKFQKFTEDVFDSMLREEQWRDFVIEDNEPSPSLIITKIENTGLRIVVNACIKPDPEEEFGSEFNLRMLKKLQGTNMLRVMREQSANEGPVKG